MAINRKALFALLLVNLMMVGAVGMAAAANEPSSTSKEIPKAVFPETRHDFKSVMEGTEIRHDFVIENHGNAPLIIKNVQTD
jgi:hypothetical protein